MNMFVIFGQFVTYSLGYTTMVLNPSIIVWFMAWQVFVAKVVIRPLLVEKEFLMPACMKYCTHMQTHNYYCFLLRMRTS